MKEEQMEKKITIKLNILQGDEDGEELDLTIFSFYSPKAKDNVFTQEQIKASRSKMLKPKIAETEMILDKFGKTLTYNITTEQLKELFDF